MPNSLQAKKAPRSATTRKTLTPRQQVALKFVVGLLAGPAGAKALEGNGTQFRQLARAGLRFADVFLDESSK